ncbi:MAG: molybdenum cofactor guanylyltransferase [Pseudomonadales bacterium]|nr:molybdenum cofactor guanylyltransferase [Pseudomonadales bacterium]
MTDLSSPSPSAIPKEDITGLILSGGKGTRMGGIDKGLVHLHKQQLVERAIRQLTPQVTKILISCNRNLDIYKALGHDTIQDVHYEDCGPLSGIYNALLQCKTPYLAVVPVDSVTIPADLITRLTSVLEQNTVRCSIVHDGNRSQPLFAVIHTDLKSDLRSFLENGERRTHAWMRRLNAIRVDFSHQQSAFININDIETLKRANNEISTPKT